MSVNQDLLESLMKSNESAKFTLYVNEKSFQMVNVSVVNSPIPVNEPTTRGGVYFSDKFAYKMKGTVEDLSVVPLLTKNMLGPNTEFGNLKITTTIKHNGDAVNLEIHTNLTNSVQTPTSIELSMIIVKLDSV